MESLALLNRMEQPVDLIITITENSSMPKIMQRFLHDLELLTDALARAETPFPIEFTSGCLYRRKEDILDQYKISEPNLLIAASPQNGTQVIFHTKRKKESIHTILTKLSLDRISCPSANLEAGFYSDWKEMKNGILEPGKFREKLC